MNEKRKTYEKLRSSKERREAYVAAKVTIGLPFQIRALRVQRGWTQKELGEKSVMRQPRISAMERPGYDGFTLDTLKRLAAAFDVALQVRYTSFGELIESAEAFSPDTFVLASFSEEYLNFVHSEAMPDTATLVASHEIYSCRQGSNDGASAVDAIVVRQEDTFGNIGSYLSSGTHRAPNRIVSSKFPEVV